MAVQPFGRYLCLFITRHSSFTGESTRPLEEGGLLRCLLDTSGRYSLWSFRARRRVLEFGDQLLEPGVGAEGLQNVVVDQAVGVFVTTMNCFL